MNLTAKILLIILFSCQFLFPQAQHEWKTFKTNNSLLPSNEIRCIAIDEQNDKWIATRNKIIKISGDDFTDPANWEIVENFPIKFFTSIQSDKLGNIWCGGILSDTGLVKYDGFTFTAYTTQNSPMPYNDVCGITIDEANNLWIMDGWINPSPIYLLKFDGINSWLQFPGNFGYQTTGDLGGIDSSGFLWTASELKLTRVNTTNNDISEWNTFGLGQYVTQVKPDDKGNIWIAGGGAGWGGLVKFYEENFNYFDIPAISLAIDSQKNLWIGTEIGISDTIKILKYDGTIWSSLTNYNSPLPKASSITDLEFDKHGNLWIATSDSGIAVYKENGLVLPVELISFIVKIENNFAKLQWNTATESNNRGFEIERKFDENSFVVIGFVNGQGTTTLPHNYTFTDKDLNPGKYKYRLKQIDFDGSYTYSKEIEVEINPLYKFELEQNHPNPFNPSTKIKFTIPTTPASLPLLTKEGIEGWFVTLKVYDILGNEIATLVNEEKPAGSYEVEFSANGLASGIYYYQLKAENYVQTKKMILLK